jgi:diguanylate cyclase (GGDEF)-like protein
VTQTIWPPANPARFKAIDEARRNQRPIALLMVDVDHFKQVNDSMGHDAGDALLRDFASNLQSSVRSCDTVARIGGDEFAVLLTGGESDSSYTLVAASLEERLCRSVRYRARSIECRASIGLAQFPRDASSADALLKCGDLALACAKLSRACTIEFEPRLADHFDSRLKAVESVAEALGSNEIVPYYQPKVDLTSGRLVGFEALMRRVQNDSLLPLPDPFDPNFVDKTLTVRVGARMTTRILDDLLTWTQAGLHVDQVAINSCAADFARDDFAETLLKELSKRGLDPRLIEIEVTEGVFLGRGSAHVARALNVLSDAGVRIALDDFGTGFASLTHLKQFPIDVLKIDRSFIAGVGNNADDAAIVRAVIGLGLNLGMEIVAEGIETAEQAEFVRRHGCGVGQGFLYGAAVPALQVQSTLSKSTKSSTNA